jgi:hypothetical protein
LAIVQVFTFLVRLEANCESKEDERSVKTNVL